MGRPGNRPRKPREIDATAERLRQLAREVDNLDEFERAGFVTFLEDGRALMAAIAMRCELDTSTEHAAALCRSLADSLEQAERMRRLHSAGSPQ